MYVDRKRILNFSSVTSPVSNKEVDEDWFTDEGEKDPATISDNENICSNGSSISFTQCSPKIKDLSSGHELPVEVSKNTYNMSNVLYFLALGVVH